MHAQCTKQVSSEKQMFTLGLAEIWLEEVSEQNL